MPLLAPRRIIIEHSAFTELCISLIHLPEVHMQDQPSLPKLLNVRQAAELMSVKPCTVRQERVRGRLGFIQIGARIFYTHELIGDYLERQKVAACAYDPRNQGPDKLETTGSANGLVGKDYKMHGIEPGTIKGLDKRAESALAQQIFKRRAER